MHSALLPTALILSVAALTAAPALRPPAEPAALAAQPVAGLPTHAQLRDALVFARGKANAGLNLDMWASVVDRDGIVRAVAFTGEERDDQWPGSRTISAQKAYTANAFSLAGLSLATANLFSAVQPGGSLYGLQHSNPIDPAVAYGGDPAHYGQPNDPLVGKKMGGINVFGGGLALYDENGTLLGAVGVSGDTSVADHNIAWRVRDRLRLDFVPGGVNADPLRPDNIVFDIGTDGQSAGGFGHPNALMDNDELEVQIASELPPISVP